MSTTNLQIDKFQTPKNSVVNVNFIKHASLFFEVNNYVIYVDPVAEFADFSVLPKADLILYTHAHFDHFCAKALADILKDSTQIIGTVEVETAAKENGVNSVKVLKNGENTDVSAPAEISVLAVPAYNTTQTQFHPKGRDNGYILTIDGMKFYIPSDCEDMPELANYKGLDVVFLPVDQPYTMTIDQCVNAVKMMQPKVFFPFHYGQTDTAELMEKLNAIDGVDVRLRIM